MAAANLLRRPLLAAARSSRLERAVSRSRSTRKLVNRFVAGETESEVTSAATSILESGRFVTIDYLGEDTTDLAQAQHTVEHYLRLLAALAEQSQTVGMVRPTEVSLKLSALGQSLARDGHEVALENAHKICVAAQEAGAWVTIDAEDHATTDSTLSIVRELRADFPALGTVLQAYLRRTEGDCRDLSGPGSRIRLCKGAYNEPASVAYRGKSDIDAAYLRCLRILVNGQGYPMVATHDPAMIEAAQCYARAKGRGRDAFEFQMLHGIREPEQLRLVEDGHSLRVYVPYGDQWYGYFMRRLAERPANVAFFLRSLGPADKR